MPLKDLVLKDLERGIRLIIRIQEEIDPQFRQATPGGDIHLAVTLPAIETDRIAMMGRLRRYMMFRQTFAFICVTELQEPDCIMAIGIGYQNTYACSSMISRYPRPWSDENFAQPIWCNDSAVGGEFRDMLPKGTNRLTTAEVLELDEWFGSSGKFPAFDIGTGQPIGI